jgi:hypothetical protein
MREEFYALVAIARGDPFGGSLKTTVAMSLTINPNSPFTNALANCTSTGPVFMKRK